ncbi:hypothetical protein CLI75_11895, partial [Porphyromonas gingivalis]
VGILHPLLKTRTTGFLPDWLSGFLIDGVYLATAWVVSVMLPPHCSRSPSSWSEPACRAHPNDEKVRPN